MAGFERHTLKCYLLTCLAPLGAQPQTACHRLARIKPAGRGAVPRTSSNQAPNEAGHRRKRLCEACWKFRSRQVAAQERAARARTSTWAEAVEKLRRMAALKEQAEIARPQPDEPVGPPTPSRPPTPSTAPKDPIATESAWDRTLANVRAGRQAHEDLGFSASVTAYFSRSAFACSARPSASSASAVTRALSLVQAWSRPSSSA
jgi:hypothetical protein